MEYYTHNYTMTIQKTYTHFSIFVNNYYNTEYFLEISIIFKDKRSISLTE